MTPQRRRKARHRKGEQPSQHQQRVAAVAMLLNASNARIRGRRLPGGIPSVPRCGPADGSLCPAQASVLIELSGASRTSPMRLLLCRRHEAALIEPVQDVAQGET